MAFPSQPAARDAVRALLRDGQTSTYATNVIFNLVRQEQLSDEIPAVATPTQTEFYVRFSSVPLGKNTTVYAIPGTIAAYVDGSDSPQTVGNGGVTQDIDPNGNFILRTPPTGQLLVTYGWESFNDGDIDQYIADANSWLWQWTDSGGIATIPTS